MSENIAAAIAAKNEVIAQQGTSLDEVAAVLETKAAGGTDISLGLTSAAVGQIIKVKAVDESGKPTAWDAADMPSGGAETWELIDTVTLTKDVVVYDLADLAVYKKVKLTWNGNKLNGNGNIWLRVIDNAGTYHDSQWLCSNFKSYMRLNVTIDARHFIYAEFLWNNNLHTTSTISGSALVDNSTGWAKTLELVFPNDVAESLNGTITVYGVRA